MRVRWRWSWVGLVLACSTVARAGEPTVIAEFDEGVDDVGLVRLTGWDARREGGDAALGLRLGADATKAGWATVELPAGIDWTGVRALGAWVRVPPVGSPRKFRWLAYDGDGEMVFQRRFELAGTGLWTRMEWPLGAWRWGNRVARWDEVRSLRLQFETKRTTIETDDWTLLPGGGPRASLEWLGELAFGGDGGRWTEGGAVVVGTDVDADAWSADDLERLDGRLEQAAAWIDRLFGDAVRPVGDDEPVPLLVFDGREEYVRFFERLGAAWRAAISEPKSSGYALQDLAASSWDAEQGWQRPVFLHEAVHALVAHRLRIATRAKNADWLQEGLANHLQLCLYPDSMEREAWARVIEEADRLDALVGRTVPGGDYAAVASIWGWLIDEHTESLPRIARVLGDGRPAKAAFEAVGLTLDEADTAWRAWAAEHLVPLAADDERHFPLPPEFRDE